MVRLLGSWSSDAWLGGLVLIGEQRQHGGESYTNKVIYKLFLSSFLLYIRILLFDGGSLYTEDLGNTALVLSMLQIQCSWTILPNIIIEPVDNVSRPILPMATSPLITTTASAEPSWSQLRAGHCFGLWVWEHWLPCAQLLVLVVCMN